MAEIPRAALDYLTRQVNGISADAKAKALRVLERLDWSDVPACRDAAVAVVNTVLDTYSLAAAQAAADFFDAAREAAVGSKLGATAVTGRDPAATEGAIRAFVDKANKGDADAFNRLVLSRIDYELKRAAADSVTANARRDPLKPKWARVPSGVETCSFCLMLASRGFVYASEKTAAGRYHGHDGCDCRIVPGWDGMTVEGYDPDAIYDEWMSQVDEMAADRAKRNGTSAGDERSKIMRGYAQASSRAKRRRRGLTEFPKTRGEHSRHSDLRATNPNFSSGERRWQENCQRCVPTYEMRRRGYDVVAKPSLAAGGQVDEVRKKWKDIFQDAKWVKCNGTGKAKIERLMKQWGDGARAEVYVKWKPRWKGDMHSGAHVFIAENVNGRVEYRCPQSNTYDYSHAFKQVIRDKTMVARIDNLEVTNLIKGCCESREE